ncbi:MAG TPA: porin family protein [Dokdonella sp.]|uniref:outer membrane protein n=1 Tax=Dokdonella sp. TaxID=2291710 RepID=UPI002C55FA34|nr:porin family protein [Dokdonella sp.]HOX70476.1 porin family protein [Dokdonella sp.]HPG93783.1 porin family protein [Dokdonella sp.]HPN80863.1 porin family protein [Dokdonella sp.]
MRNILLVTALAAAGLTAIPVASHAAEDNAGFFINGNVGQSTLDKGIYDDNDTAYGVNLGYRWSLAPNFALGVEGGYTDLGKWSPSSGVVAALPAGEFVNDAELSGWTAGINAHLNLSDNWYLSGRTGLFRADIKGDQVIAGLPVRSDETSNKWYAGAGFGYDFSNRFSVGLNYDYYKADKNGLKLDPSLVSVSAETRF